MKTLFIKISPQLEEEIVLASEREHLNKSELVRRALVAYLSQRNATVPTLPALEQAGDLVGCFSGGPPIFPQTPITLMISAAYEQPLDSRYRPLGGLTLPE